ncbi:MAG TPA: carbamoyltransferase HypF [Longimicrobiales bacterium]|nr:carbamoyltransferase HypF [Longimicrobiales bacterium]
MSAAERVAREVHVQGVVQGVGFRPFVHRLAMRYGLAGAVRNESGEVRIEIEGEPAAVDAFVRELRTEAPPLARIDALDVAPAEPSGRAVFEIAPSVGRADRRLPVSPDVAICDACAAELLDPGDRRFRYPFITCTDCGPRYTVIETMPYDRERTSMRAFPQCPACAAEYHDPADRRYHSETNSCPACGPRVWLSGPDRRTLAEGDEAIRAAGRLIKAGLIVALRGLGGFHLAVDAGNRSATARLRRHKHREAKPLAVMVRTLEEARTLAHVDEAAAELLASRERPVVVLPKRAPTPLAPEVAPGLAEVGVMLAYTPMHLLLLEEVDRPLVMTSGNASEEPIAIGNEEAIERLGTIADALLLHEREIVSRYDDSVVRAGEGGAVFLRRARGFAPLPLDLPVPTPRPLVAVGPHLKNTFALAVGASAFVSQHIGDLENVETLDHFRATLERYRALFNVRPEIAVRDLHPGYLSTRVADELGLGRTIPVQHHHAHIAAVMAEHGRTQPVVGLAFDGTGYGDDGHTWGAEVLIADLTGYRRFAHLRYAPLPGGDLAARRPWRVALGYLSLDPERAPALARALAGVPERERELVEQQIRRNLNSPLASSMGRLFDAAAAVLGVRTESQYEGQAAMELEALAGALPARPLPIGLGQADGRLVLDPLPLLEALADRAARGVDRALLAARFHETVAAAATTLAELACADARTDVVALGGGVFQNLRLLRSLRWRLEAAGLRVLLPRRLSPNDGAISYGQAAVAAALLTRDRG